MTFPTKGKGKEREQSPEHAVRSIEGPDPRTHAHAENPVVSALDFAKLQRLVANMAEKLDDFGRRTMKPRPGTTPADPTRPPSTSWVLQRRHTLGMVVPRFLPEADTLAHWVFLPARSFTFQRRQQLV